ncbi:FlgD immunoglobulin-like domain containing protein [Sulfurospirillum sp. 1307]|jgi:flagellar basal-body rod modification protein FlgD
MATDITSTSNVANSTNQISAASAGIAVNPDSVLDKNSFMKLLLVELQYQDPTQPMDSEKILTQTSQLATLESADNTNKTMEELTNRLNNNMDMGALSAIGKMASLGSDAVSLPEDSPAKFEMYFPDKIQSGTLSITDVNGNVVKTVDLDAQTGQSGVLAFEWDGYSNSGERLSAGNYSVKADYTNENGKAQKTQFGVYPVESVRYEAGKPQMKLGSSYVSMDYIKEFF